MRFETIVGNKKLMVNTENLAEQANGSAFIRYGDTEILATCVMSKEEKEQDFFPLTVEYEERYYAAGKIRGPRYIRRETRPSDEAICNARMVDRAIRPLFPKELKREVQVINTVLSWDGENDPDVLALLASSIALLISDIPWSGPIGALRIGKINGNYILNPTYRERENSEMGFVLSGVLREGDILINMMEGKFNEINDEELLRVVQFSKPHLRKLIDFQNEIWQKVGKEKIKIEKRELEKEEERELEKFLLGKIENLILKGEYRPSGACPPEGEEKGIEKLKKEFFEFVNEKFPEKINLAKDFFYKKIADSIHKIIIEKEIRPDGRSLEEIRKLEMKVGVLPRTHGSAIFSRGQTKVLSILTLGAPGDVQLLEGMEIVGKKRFMHHYNFPPYCSGEVRPLRGPGRREIGHGVLVEKTLLPLIPSFEEFPYTIRCVSEVLSSNGSTSMASVSSSVLALMDAGVPIKAMAAGISIGLMMGKDGQYKLLTDIQGPEDGFGDMDFKIAGTEKGILSIQMDVKIDGISEKILKEALERGKKARMQILEKMKEVLPEPRKELSPFAPKTLTIQIDPEKIRDVIGPGGRVINEIIEECGVSIDVEETGKIYVTAEKEEAAKKAIGWIKNITRTIKVGEVFQGKIKRVLSFGAFVEILPNQEGLLHVSKLDPRQTKRRGTFLRVGKIIPVKVISIDKQGRINLALVKFEKKLE
jgi:polyribonucleotide nucleotidyltransferase